MGSPSKSRLASKGGVKTDLRILKMHLLSIFKEEAKLQWPTDAPVPSLLMARCVPMLGGRTKQREGLEEITEEEGMDVVAKVSAAGYQPRARVRTWQQDAPPISRDMIGGTVAFCFDMTPTSKTVTPQYVEGQVEDVSDGKSRYLPKGGKTDKGGREYGPRWVYVVFDQDGYEDSDMWLHLRGGSFYNPKKPKPGAWKLSA